MAITFNPIIKQGIVYWHTGLGECSYPSCLFACQLRELSRNFPRRTPPTDNCIFVLRTVKKILITAISENSSFLAKSLLRQMVEKRLEVQGSMGVVDLEIAFDTVPRETVMATIRWM